MQAPWNPGRPFVARRFNRLRAIVMALREEALRPHDVAGLLGCTITSVRRDLLELRKVGLVSLVPARVQEAAAPVQPRFRLTSDDAAVAAYLDGVLHCQEGQGNRRHDAPPPIRRDPLVAALFGNPGIVRPL